MPIKPWVKTSLAPGSRVVTAYLEQAGLTKPLQSLGFTPVGYGCTTCIGNSGPLPEPVSKAIHDGNLAVCSVLSGNRNFEGRVHAEVRMNYLASPPLVVAYALAGRMDIDLHTEPLGTGSDGRSVYLKDIWPSQQEIQAIILQSVKREKFRSDLCGDIQRRDSLERAGVPRSETYAWDDDSTYIRRPPYFDGMARQPGEPGRHPGCTGTRTARRLGHHRPYFTGRRHQAGQPRRQISREPRASRRTISIHSVHGAAITR